MNRRLILIGIQEENLQHLFKQVDHIFNGSINVSWISVKELNYGMVKEQDIVLLTGTAISEIVKPFLPEKCVCIPASRTVNIVNTKELLHLAHGKHILVVNDNEKDAIQTANALKQIVPEHVYFPFGTNGTIMENIDVVVTPGEVNLVPKGFPMVIDLGPRVISFDTIKEVCEYFSLEFEETLLFNGYIRSLVFLFENKVANRPSILEDQNQQKTFDQFRTRSPIMLQTKNIAQKLAVTHQIIHIEGETGTGKRMMAEMIHNESLNRSLPFYIYNCADKDAKQMEKELFGDKESKLPGVLEAARSCTLYMKNIDHIPNRLQGKLLEWIKINERFDEKALQKIRLIFSTIDSLQELANKNVIRRDFYSYLSSYRIRMPSLTERIEDLEMLIDAFKAHLKKGTVTFSGEVIDAFLRYEWSGNVRELYNVVSYCVCLNIFDIEIDSLPLFFKGIEKKTASNNDEIDLKEVIDEIEKHGFLEESINLLKILKKGKEQNKSYGRKGLQKQMNDKENSLTDQQLRLRLEVLKKMGLLNVRKGRAGTTISSKGEQFLNMM
ncbi:sigma 54-interacting transcriptional regulator [Bacillus sp. REN16]|uniref:sigma 54-interacting transcriptional regulator n=1 Tax=Bacillus sp. REN16 TaxID=2887296 RepID=UPI001E31206E|nr:sigma 54-interacting transcriptional regulator [Bacillus sp. REN16]MCC3356132.1 sigma 54-interacting transcriptional regulator [Bacillus sp. REN16]